ncbi:MAG: T9SS type A sorting domain-containing protein, partial [Bacteroidales bacterium]|nr:T9SS type A sorting domain-containing protein [Bacteroidales bacterium]
IKQVDVNGTMRRQYFFSGTSITGFVWTEGIGAIDGEGLFAPIADVCLCGEEYHLACVKQNDTVIFLDNPICATCFCSMNTEHPDAVNFEKYESLADIFPNPANDKLTIIVRSRAMRYQRYRQSASIYSLQGQLLLQKTVTQEKPTIDISRLAKGLYILKLTNDTGTMVTTFVKK